MPHVGDVRGGRILPGNELRRIAGDEVEHQEDEDRDADQDRHCLQDAPQQEPAHTRRAPFALTPSTPC